MSSAPSPARQLANAANAQRSTGPRTHEGKARAARNALKHGLTAKEPVIDAEARREFEEMRAGFQVEINPQGPLQQTMFDELVAAAWNLRRIQRMEAALFAQAPSDLELLNDGSLQKKLDCLARHHTRLERTFYRALREIRALHTELAIAATLPQVIVENVPKLASAMHIAKRTQTLDRDYERRAARPVPGTLDFDFGTSTRAAGPQHPIPGVHSETRLSASEAS